MATPRFPPSFRPTGAFTLQTAIGEVIEVAASDPSALDANGFMYEQKGRVWLVPWGQVTCLSQPVLTPPET